MGTSFGRFQPGQTAWPDQLAGRPLPGWTAAGWLSGWRAGCLATWLARPAGRPASVGWAGWPGGRVAGLATLLPAMPTFFLGGGDSKA